MNKTDKTVVCGAGGFIGGHLVGYLRQLGYTSLCAVDIKPQTEWYQHFVDIENLVLDLRDKDNCYQALQGAAHVYNLAADMGGMGSLKITERCAC